VPAVSPSRFGRLSAVLLLVLAVLAGAACGGPRAEPSSTPERSVGPAPAGRAHYTTTPEPGGVRGGPAAAALAARVAELLPRAQLTPDGRLAELAEWIARTAQARQASPDVMEISHVARRLGFVGPTPFTAVMPREGAAWRNLETYVASLPANLEVTHLGVSVFDVPGGQLGALALASVHLEIEPLPRHVEPGASLSIRGRLGPKHRNAELVWTRPDGSIDRRPVAARPALDVNVSPLVKGQHQVEILAEGPTGLMFVLNVPLFAGFAEPELPAAPSEAADTDEPIAVLLRLANDARRRAGARPLELHEDLARLAQAHSNDMVETGFFGHQSPTTGEVFDRFRAAGFRLTTVGENVALGPHARAAHAQLMDSPGHRANIENPLFSHVGIGVAWDARITPPALVVTQVFATLPRPIPDRAAAARDLIRELSRAREQRGLAPLEEEPSWTRAAVEVLRRVEAHPGARVADVARQVPVAGRHGGPRPQLLAAVVADPRELAQDPQLHAPGWRYVGAAVGAPKEMDAREGRTRVILYAGP
jgi:hypothetical protein